jgi:hypothetical protein
MKTQRQAEYRSDPNLTVKASPPATITIEKGVAFEPHERCRSLYSRTLDKMEVGDSILVSHAKRAGLFNLAAYHGWEIKTRAVDQKHIRVWMIGKDRQPNYQS